MTKFVSLVIASMLAATPVFAQTQAQIQTPAPKAPIVRTAEMHAPMKPIAGKRSIRLAHVRAECRHEAYVHGLKGGFARHAIAKCERAHVAFRGHHKSIVRLAHKSVTKTVTKLKG